MWPLKTTAAYTGSADALVRKLKSNILKSRGKGAAFVLTVIAGEGARGPGFGRLRLAL